MGLGFFGSANAQDEIDDFINLMATNKFTQALISEYKLPEAHKQIAIKHYKKIFSDRKYVAPLYLEIVKYKFEKNEFPSEKIIEQLTSKLTAGFRKNGERRLSQEEQALLFKYTELTLNRVGYADCASLVGLEGIEGSRNSLQVFADSLSPKEFDELLTISTEAIRLSAHNLSRAVELPAFDVQESIRIYKDNLKKNAAMLDKSSWEKLSSESLNKPSPERVCLMARLLYKSMNHSDFNIHKNIVTSYLNGFLK